MATPEQRLNQIEKELERRFALFNRYVEQNLGNLILAGALDQTALQQGMTREINRFAAAAVRVFLQGAELTALEASELLSQPVFFDSGDALTLATISELRSRIIQGLEAQQRDAINQIRQMAAQISPAPNLQDLKRSLPLTARQTRAVVKYRQLLEQNSAEALQRALRDKRFDSTVRRAIQSGQPLTQDQIDKMVSRYAEKQQRFRAQRVAATEAVRIANQSDHVLYQQLISRGELDPDSLERTWTTSGDEKVRDTHRSISGVTHAFGEPWVTSAGNTLRFPGDPMAPISEVAQCRCWLTTNVKANPLRVVA